MDGNTSATFQCTVFTDHVMQYDGAASGPDKSVFTCPCGAQITEAEDCNGG